MNNQVDRINEHNHNPLEKYAHDLVYLYQNEWQRRMALGVLNPRFLSHDRELKKTFSLLKPTKIDTPESQLDTILRLMLAAEYENEKSINHIVRIGKYSALIAKKMGLPYQMVQNILYAAPMHDIGKIGIPNNILLKQGKLTNKEFNLMKKHTIIGAKILAASRSEIIQEAKKIAISHHEKWDGSGYPNNLYREQIPMVGRIVAIADVFDALISERPYKKTYSIEVASSVILSESGYHFDPKIAEVFLNNLDDVMKIKEDIDETDYYDINLDHRDTLEEVFEYISV